MRARSMRSCSRRICADGWRLLSPSSFLAWPALCVRLGPPPWIRVVASPEPAPPDIDTRNGDWKYSEMPFRSPCVVEPSSHISRKNAIIAVTKSAYAIFQAAP